MAVLSPRDWVRSWDIWWELSEELLLLCVERSQLRYTGHLIKMPPGCLPLELKGQLRWEPWVDPELAGGITYLSHQAWECLWIPQEKLGSVAGEWDVWNIPAEPPATTTQHWKSGSKWIYGWMYGFIVLCRYSSFRLFISRWWGLLFPLPPFVFDGVLSEQP